MCAARVYLDQLAQLGLGIFKVFNDLMLVVKCLHISFVHENEPIIKLEMYMA